VELVPFFSFALLMLLSGGAASGVDAGERMAWMTILYTVSVDFLFIKNAGSGERLVNSTYNRLLFSK
jgi:hypothetical protein